MEHYNDRYARHYSLKDFGPEGQQKLAAAHVLVIGAGGLGCPVLQYLTAAGVGTIGIVDNDVVALSNLQRQVLYDTDDIGKHKVIVAKLKLEKLNPEVIINSYDVLLTSANALQIITHYNVVVDCTDNFAARYLINDACMLLGKPLVFGAIYRYEGQVAVFNVSDKEGVITNYRHLFTTPPNPLEVADCNEAGVLGVLPGMIGSMQATEVIKLVTGIGTPLINKLLTFSLLTYDNFVLEITVNNDANMHIPKDETAFKAMDYNWLCGISISDIEELEIESFLKKIRHPDTIVIDVRESYELPKVDFECVNISLSKLNVALPDVEQHNIILFCQGGKRSLKAAQLLLGKYGTLKKISHLKGGIITLKEYTYE